MTAKKALAQWPHLSIPEPPRPEPDPDWPIFDPDPTPPDPDPAGPEPLDATRTYSLEA